MDIFRNKKILILRSLLIDFSERMLNYVDFRVKDTFLRSFAMACATRKKVNKIFQMVI